MTHGDGSVFKTVTSSGKTQWKVEVTIGHNPDGSRRRTRRTASSHAHAIKLRRQLVADRDDYNLSFENPTLDSFALWWIRDVRAQRVKAATAADYEHRYRRTISPFLGNKKIADIRPNDVTQWISLLRDDYASASINGALRVLKMVLSGATENGHARTNAAQAIQPLRHTDRYQDLRVEPWSAWEAKKAVRAAQNHWFGVAIILGVVLGMRKGEILALKWGDIDFSKGEISVTKSVRESARYGPDGVGSMVVEEGAPKTRASRRNIPVSQDVMDFLEQRMRESSLPPFCEDEFYVLSSGDPSAPLSNARFRKGFKSYLEESGSRPVRFHDLRHTAATVALENGVRIESVSQALGHSRIDTTKSIYAPMVSGLNSEFSEANHQSMFNSDI